MKNIGLIVAIEMDAVFQKYNDLKKCEAPNGFEVYLHQDENYQLYFMHCGMGTIMAAAATQLLIDKYNVDMIINFGVVGGLTESMQVEKLVAVEKVVHYRYDCSEFMDLKVGQVDGHDSIFLPTDPNLLKKALQIAPDLKKVTIASGDKFVSTKNEKNEIHEKFSCDICDMESSGIILVCQANNIPCLLLKAVSDGLSGGANQFWEELLNVSLTCLDITDKVIHSMFQ